MDYEIKRGNTVIATVRPTGVLQKGIMNANLVRFDFDLPYPVFLQRGDHITVYRENFYLNRLPEYTKDDKSNFIKYAYNCFFESVAYNLAKVSFRFLDANNNFTTAEFTITGTLDAFIDLLIRNANRAQSGWVKGVVDLTETKTIAFTNQKCLEVMAIFATEFNTEWWVDGQTIHMTRKGKPSGIKLEYGMNKGLTSLQRRNVENANAVNTVYVQGGTKNLPGEYRNYSRRLQLPAATGGFLQKNVGADGIIETDLIFEEVYPHRVGTVTAVTDKYTFADASLDFDINEYLLPGVTAKVVFNTGPLAGYEFEINNFKNDGKVFTINHNKDDKALEIPSERIHALPGDKYVLIGIKMPESYINFHEADLQAKGQAYLDKNSVDRFVYFGEPDRLSFKRAGLELRLGDTVELKDADLQVEVSPRIVSFERDLHDAYYYPNVDYSEHVDIPALVRQYAEQDKINQAVLKSDIITNPHPAQVPVRTPTRYPIELKSGFSPGFDDPFYYKNNHIAYLGGQIFQDSALAPFFAFNLPLGYRPWYAQEIVLQVYVVQKMQFGFFSGWGTLTIKNNGDAFVSAPIPVKQIQSIDLTNVSFYTGMG